MISLSDRSSHYGLLMGNFAVSTLGWLVTAGLMLLDPQLLLQHYYQGRTIAMVHSFTLLTISPAILGVLYQLLPVVVEGALASRPLAWITSLLWWTGATGFVISRFFNLAALSVFAVLLFLAILLFLLQLTLTVNSGHWNGPARLVVAASLWLLVMALSGSFMSARVSGALSGFSLMQWHTWTGMIGWFALMVVALGTRLLPMFLLSHGMQERWALASGILLAVFPCLLFVAMLLDWEFRWIPTLVAVLGYALFLIYLFSCIRKRMRRRLEAGMSLFVISFAFPLIALILLMAGWDVALILSTTGRASSPAWSAGAALCMLAGFVGSATLGMSFKILPFMGWMAVQSRVPQSTTSQLNPRSLAAPALQRILLVAYPISVIALLIGMHYREVLHFAALLFLICTLINAAHFIYIVREVARRSL
ncbi:MAG: hypothetical protein CMN76_18825 [Spirochaetaceae bacterium]|nr:hypothetical protein [Spirochaetaceae bacterium]|tara:strand:- start:62358 stop:63623 length:1266 start_codon:yes stop_codon:yes gene_type:complete